MGMSRILKSMIALGALWVGATGRAGAEADAQWPFGEPPSRLASSMVCGSLTETDLTAPDHFAALDPEAGLALMRALAESHPDLALAAMQWLPVEGWVPSFGAKGEFEGYLAFDPAVADIGSILDRLSEAVDPATGLTVESVEVLHADLGQILMEQDAVLPDEQSVLVRGVVRVSMDGTKELVLSSERRRFTGRSLEGEPVHSDAGAEIAVVLSETSQRDLPVLSFSDVRARAPVHTVDAVRVVRGSR